MSATVTSARSMMSETNWVNSGYLLVRAMERPHRRGGWETKSKVNNIGSRLRELFCEMKVSYRSA